MAWRHGLSMVEYRAVGLAAGWRSTASYDTAGVLLGPNMFLFQSCDKEYRELSLQLAACGVLEEAVSDVAGCELPIFRTTVLEPEN